MHDLVAQMSRTVLEVGPLQSSDGGDTEAASTAALEAGILEEGSDSD